MHHYDDYLASLKIRAQRGDYSIRYREWPAILRGQWPPHKKDPSKPYKLPDGSWNVQWDPELQVLWPEFWTREKLLEDWLNDPGAFSLTRMHIITPPEGQLFPLSVLQQNCRANGLENMFGTVRPSITAWYVEWDRRRNMAKTEAEGLHLKKIVLAIDPAATAKTPGREPDYTAIELWGLAEDNIRVLLWLDRFRTGDPRIAKERISKPILAFEPDEVVYEAQAMERFFAFDLSHELGIPIKTRGLRRQKNEELHSLAGFAGSGMMLYAWGDPRSEAMMAIFEEELSQYPHGRHDDTVTAALHAFWVFKERKGPEGGKAVVISKEQEEKNEEKNERRRTTVRDWRHVPRRLIMPERVWPW